MRNPLAGRPWPEKVAIGLALLMTFAAYARIFFCLGLLDESQHLGTAMLSSLGGKPFENELFIQQTASLLYEPLVYLYYKIFGNFAIMLAFRNVLFVLTLFWAREIYLFFRSRSGVTAALSMCLVPICGMAAAYPSLNYNALGMWGFGLGSLWLLRALERGEIGR